MEAKYITELQNYEGKCLIDLKAKILFRYQEELRCPLRIHTVRGNIHVRCQFLRQTIAGEDIFNGACPFNIKIRLTDNACKVLDFNLSHNHRQPSFECFQLLLLSPLLKEIKDAIVEKRSVEMLYKKRGSLQISMPEELSLGSTPKKKKKSLLKKRSLTEEQHKLTASVVLERLITGEFKLNEEGTILWKQFYKEKTIHSQARRNLIKGINNIIQNTKVSYLPSFLV